MTKSELIAKIKDLSSLSVEAIPLAVQALNSELSSQNIEDESKHFGVRKYWVGDGSEGSCYIGICHSLENAKKLLKEHATIYRALCDERGWAL